MTLTDYEAEDWFGLDWTGWIQLNPTNEHLSHIPSSAGLYRVRHPDKGGLEYIGETARTRGRVRALARETHRDLMPYRDPHTAAPCLWAVRDATGPGLEISVATPEWAEKAQRRKGLEAALIAVHRRETGESPTANFGRIIPGYEQSSYSKGEVRGGPLDSDESETNAEPGVGPLPWKQTDNVTARDWMGLDWSEPFRLRDRLNVSPPDTGLYRIWHDDQAPPLAYVGESSGLPRRLYNHEKDFGGDVLASFVARPDLDAQHKRLEIETELIGAHYLAHDKPPVDQFG